MYLCMLYMQFSCYFENIQRYDDVTYEMVIKSLSINLLLTKRQSIKCLAKEWRGIRDEVSEASGLVIVDGGLWLEAVHIDGVDAGVLVSQVTRGRGPVLWKRDVVLIPGDDAQALSVGLPANGDVLVWVLRLQSSLLCKTWKEILKSLIWFFVMRGNFQFPNKVTDVLQAS